MKLSVGIITFNEEMNIGRTLESIKNIADEIIIIDSGSKDKTEEIARRYTDKFYFNSWEGFGKQKNLALSKCQGEWVLLIDADEEISPELAEKIKNIINNEKEKYVFSINRCSICFGKMLNHGGWSNQYATRLWKNGAVKISEKLVHEEYETIETIYKIKEKIYHHTYNTLEDYFGKFNKYTTLGAKDYFEKGKKPSSFQIVFNPLFKFIRMYIIRLGFLDGIEGFMIAVASAMYSMVKYFKLREIYRNDVYKN